MSWTSEFTKNGLNLALSNPLKATCFDLVDKDIYDKMRKVKIWMQYGKMYLISDLLNIEYLL